MSNPFKVILALAAGFLLYYTLHLLVTLIALAICALIVAVLIHAYKVHTANTKSR